MESRPLATKRQLLEQLLEQGMVLVALDARNHGVHIPNHLGADPQLRLNLSYRFGLPMAVEDWGVSATLTFSGIQHDCRIPWEAIFLMVSHVTGKPYLFPEDVPRELLAGTGIEDVAEDQTNADAVADAVTERTPSCVRPHLKVVTGDDVGPDGSRKSFGSHVLGNRTATLSRASTASTPRPALACSSSATSASESRATDDNCCGAHPRAVDGPTPDDDPPPCPRRLRRGHLRLVK